MRQNQAQKSFHKQETNRYSPYQKFSDFKKSGRPKTKSIDLKELTSISKIKSKLRDTSRLLKKPNLASNVRTEIERKVTNLEILLKEKEVEEHRRKFFEKNKGIMHIEKKKCLRSLKQLTKQLEGVEEEEQIEKLEHSLFETNLNLNYIKYYPITEDKYYPLFGANQKEKALEKKDSIKEQIKTRMLSGEFENDDGDDEDGQSNSKVQKSLGQLPKTENVEDKPKKNAILNDDFFAVGGSDNNNDANGDDVKEAANGQDNYESSSSSDSESDSETSSDSSESESESNN